MKTVQTADANAYSRMTAEELQTHFLVPDLFQAGRVELVSTDVDRAIVGGIVPIGQALVIDDGREMASDFFFERREAGVVNLGAPGIVTVDGDAYTLATHECLYVGRGSREIAFASDTSVTPAMFYLVSYPAHSDFPTTHAGLDGANRLELGSQEDANRRTLFQYIHPDGIHSCQLVMGFTELHEGSVWNTFPPHTHDRRSEVYCYFDLPADGCVVHLLGRPLETKHLVVHEKQVVLSPPWSIHSGAGSGSYRFVWAMGGENQAFDDMDKVEVIDLQ